ncbi:hypothetical protein FLJC2902T_01200 [Flavobacterium limnosediminis JC2902]|uniref:Uncharacterized protein n=1 Tax=Flavobacterium limnosediminis JC2902 TaxID=1341181 RepID=V6SSJ7_9FLAO|nr:hypothetical protein FLJC2902T_01200 [Flavobacterium limnosediminis JC2902]
MLESIEIGVLLLMLFDKKVNDWIEKGISLLFLCLIVTYF